MRTADQAAAAWVAGLANAGQKITDGVNSVTAAPGQLAARQKAVYTANVAANADKWAKNVAAVSLQTWQQDTISKGIPRIATGAAAAQAKMGAFLTKLLPYIAAGKGSLPARGSFDQNIARMTAWARYMHGFSK
jgi:hypothetical protein